VKIACLSPIDQGSSSHYIRNAIITEKYSKILGNRPVFFNQGQQPVSNFISASQIESTEGL
jgi:hypothetical protein